MEVNRQFFGRAIEFSKNTAQRFSKRSGGVFHPRSLSHTATAPGVADAQAAVDAHDSHYQRRKSQHDQQTERDQRRRNLGEACGHLQEKVRRKRRRDGGQSAYPSDDAPQDRQDGGGGQSE